MSKSNFINGRAAFYSPDARVIFGEKCFLSLTYVPAVDIKPSFDSDNGFVIERTQVSAQLGTIDTARTLVSRSLVWSSQYTCCAVRHKKVSFVELDLTIMY